MIEKWETSKADMIKANNKLINSNDGTLNEIKENLAEAPFKVVLFQPEIPANTGNIGRMCVGLNAELHIIKPMRFMINDKYLKRAGLDYWDKLKVFYYDRLQEMIEKYPNSNFYYLTTKSDKTFYNAGFKRDDAFVFGPESRGIPEEVLTENKETALTIPMSDNIRSINLSNSVAIVLYEALRQISFDNKA
jgi:tRNA (cytidine/uridine-2'-O-)-methyltransferase